MCRSKFAIAQFEIRNSMVNESDRRFMSHALDEARVAYDAMEVPVGAVVVRDNRIIGKGHNQREELLEPTSHAEIVAIREAARALGSWRLEGCTLYVTLEPCVMCAGALVQARVDRLVFGCLDPKGGGVRSLYRICEDDRVNHRILVEEGVLQQKCASILKDFFDLLRKAKS
jgi:tRNA(adenine34) deaminase